MRPPRNLIGKQFARIEDRPARHGGRAHSKSEAILKKIVSPMQARRRRNSAPDRRLSYALSIASAPIPRRPSDVLALRIPHSRRAALPAWQWRHTILRTSPPTRTSHRNSNMRFLRREAASSKGEFPYEAKRSTRSLTRRRCDAEPSSRPLVRGRRPLDLSSCQKIPKFLQSRSSNNDL